MTTTDPKTEALIRCAEIKTTWADRLENQRPPVTNRIASDAWWRCTSTTAILARNSGE